VLKPQYRVTIVAYVLGLRQRKFEFMTQVSELPVSMTRLYSCSDIVTSVR
jgi:hypothetical protein